MNPTPRLNRNVLSPRLVVFAASLALVALALPSAAHAQVASAALDATTRIREALFPAGASELEAARLRARLSTYWMLPLKERTTVWEAARKGERGTVLGIRADAAQAAGLAAGLSAGNPLSGKGLVRGGNALAAVAVLSLLMPSKASEAQPHISRLYLARETPDGEIKGRDDAWKAAVQLTQARLRDAARSLGRDVRCESGCDTHVQVWRLEGGDGAASHTVVWRRSADLNWSVPDYGRNAAMPFWPSFESPGQNGWVIELTDIERDVDGKAVMRDRDGVTLPIPTESWALTPDGIRFLRALTASGNLVIGRAIQRFVAVQGHVYELGELTAEGFIGAELQP